MTSQHVGMSTRLKGVTTSKSPGKYRAQISSGGRTVSLGDYATEAEAARAFDRASLHRTGASALTNFPAEAYADELPRLRGMSQTEVVGMLRAAARGTATGTGQSSHYRGVSLLRRTGRWHAQINFDGRQVHLGFFSQEEDAAGAYDRALIIKWAAANGGAGAVLGPQISPQPMTNFNPHRYSDELARLVAITPGQLVAALGSDGSRREAMEALAHGFSGEGGAAAGKWEHPTLVPAQPETPVLMSVQPIVRHKRRKLEVPVRGCIM